MELKRRTLALTDCLGLWLLGSMPLALAQAATRLQQGIMRRPCRHRGRARDFDLAGAPLSAECRAVGAAHRHGDPATDARDDCLHRHQPYGAGRTVGERRTLAMNPL